MRTVSDLKYGRAGLSFLFALLWGCASASSPEPRVETTVVSERAVSKNCPQVRKTPSAPKAKRDRFNPVYASGITLQMGQRLYQNAKPLACKLCHGERGDGKGDPDFESMPPARNFTCTSTMNKLSDGQLFWIIKNGSPNTSMPAFADLSEQDIWTLVYYLRSFSKSQ